MEGEATGEKREEMRRGQGGEDVGIRTRRKRWGEWGECGEVGERGCDRRKMGPAG